MGRTFDDKPAVRERVPLLLGLMGPSGGGKTFSALRLATGIQRVSGGDIYVVDTEARRALHYADVFAFRHIAFGAPFGPLDYLAAIDHCVKKGAGVVIVDSMSHEHEGQGGVLEMHEAETARLAKLWGTSEKVASMAGWAKPKQERRRLINSILQTPCNFIFCWRAKEKLKIKRGEDPRPLGWMPIAGEEFVYEMAVNALLLPGANGVPTWQPDELGEKQMVKFPGWAHGLFPARKPLDEDTGAKLAEWAAGTAPVTLDDLLASLGTCSDPATLGTIKAEARTNWRSYTKAQQGRLNAAVSEAEARLRAIEEMAQDHGDPDDAPAFGDEAA